MDSWQVAQNYIVLLGGAGALGAYYYYTTKQPNRTGSANALVTKRSESDLRGRGGNGKKNRERSDSIISNASRNTSRNTSRNNSSVRQRKAKAGPAKSTPAVVEETVQEDVKPVKESDMSTAHFAEQMMQARKGADLSSSKRQEQRVKTVKPKAMLASTTTSTPEVDPADSVSSFSQPVNGQDVSDMLEASTPGPSTLRITAASAPAKPKALKQAKEEVVESKKQRQNRKKMEERREQRLAEEKDRKQLEERQRRSAREARGEPAKNGLSAAKAPQTSAWDASSSAVTQQHETAPLLDTFDAESTSSSNGGLTTSTTATSTTDGEQHQQQNWNSMPEEAQIAVALERSDAEYGWTTVSAPKKTTNKKNLPSGDNSSGIATPNKQAGKAANGKLGKTGFSALELSEDVEV